MGAGRGPVSDPGSVINAVEVAHERAPGWVGRPREDARDAWDVVEVGLLRDLAGARFLEIGNRPGSSGERAARVYRRHAALRGTYDGYAARAGGVVRVSLARAGLRCPGRRIR
ncbi:MAG: hypothetical protein ACI8QZ_004212 [Chlamydiales bacterium]|jgi:hypothetical protein